MAEKVTMDAPWASRLVRLRRGALWLLFASVLLIPKTIALRRRPCAWNKVRVAVALLGAVFILTGLADSMRSSWRFGPLVLASIFMGTLFVVFSVMVAPDNAQVPTGVPPNSSASDRETGVAQNASPDAIDACARALGAYVVVDGGRCRTAEGAPRSALLFVGPRQLSVLDTALRTIIAIPVGQIARVLVEADGEDWKVRISWESLNTEFLYRGFFAEHLARVAEMTINSQLRRELPILR